MIVIDSYRKKFNNLVTASEDLERSLAFSDDKCYDDPYKLTDFRITKLSLAFSALYGLMQDYLFIFHDLVLQTRRISIKEFCKIHKISKDFLVPILEIEKFLSELNDISPTLLLKLDSEINEKLEDYYVTIFACIAFLDFDDQTFQSKRNKTMQTKNSNPI